MVDGVAYMKVHSNFFALAEHHGGGGGKGGGREVSWPNTCTMEASIDYSRTMRCTDGISSEFSLSSLFGCHVAWPNMGGRLFVCFLGAWKFLGAFSPPKVPPMSGTSLGPMGVPHGAPMGLPHGAPKRLPSGPDVNFHFSFYD